jgi:hypothetical protein
MALRTALQVYRPKALAEFISQPSFIQAQVENNSRVELPNHRVESFSAQCRLELRGPIFKFFDGWGLELRGESGKGWKHLLA